MKILRSIMTFDSKLAKFSRNPWWKKLLDVASTRPWQNSPLFFPKKRDSGFSPYLNGKLEILLSSPKRRCLQNETFEEKLSFRQNSLSLGFSYGKAAKKNKVEKVSQRNESITLSLEEGPPWRGWPKMRKTKGHKKKRASVEALPGKRGSFV